MRSPEDKAKALVAILTRLAALHPQLARVAILVYVRGLTSEEAAKEVGTTQRNVERDRLLARLWIHAEWKKWRKQNPDDEGDDDFMAGVRMPR